MYKAKIMEKLKVKSKEELIRYRKENSQWGYAWDGNNESRTKKLIIDIFEDGTCITVVGIYTDIYLKGGSCSNEVIKWEHYKLIEDIDSPIMMKEKYMVVRVLKTIEKFNDSSMLVAPTYEVVNYGHETLEGAYKVKPENGYENYIVVQYWD